MKRKRSTLTAQSTVDISADIHLLTSDIITVHVTQGSGAAATINNGRDVTYFNAFKVY